MHVLLTPRNTNSIKARTMRIKKADSTSIPGGRSDDDKTRLSFLLDTGHLSRADRAAIWRSYTTAVVSCSSGRPLSPT